MCWTKKAANPRILPISCFDLIDEAEDDVGDMNVCVVKVAKPGKTRVIASRTDAFLSWNAFEPSNNGMPAIIFVKSTL